MFVITSVNVFIDSVVDKGRSVEIVFESVVNDDEMVGDKVVVIGVPIVVDGVAIVVTNA